MGWIDLIKRCIDVSIEYLRLITSNLWTPEFLLFTSILGLLLCTVSSKLWKPCIISARILGIIFTTFGLVSITIAILFGMDIHFNFNELSSCPRSKTAANNYLIIGENQHKAVERALPINDCSTSKSNNVIKRHGTGTKQTETLGENQHKAVERALPTNDFSTSKWYNVIKWHGTGTKQTETFQISSNLWMVDWNTVPTGGSPGLFSIKVNSAKGKSIGFAANTKGEDRGRTFIKNKGDYYLVIETKQKYMVTVMARQ
jgi:hypothetical protein